MKKFYDRVREMNELMELQRQAYNDYSRFVVLTGRRRVGKTSLVYRLMSETQDDAPGLYFFVGRKTETVLVRSFVQEVREKLGEFVPDGMSSFRELFRYFVDEGKKILIQEFGKQYGTYFSILDQIAHGDVTQSEIEGALGMKSLGGQMKILEEKYGIIKKKRPIGAKEGSQTVRYEIQDNFFRFWFRYINRYAALI